MATGKIFLSKTTKCIHAKSSLFHPHFTHSLRSTCHSTCPLPQRVLLSKRTSRLYESLPQPRAAPFLRKQSDFAILEALNPSEIALFGCFSSYSRTTGAPMQTLIWSKIFPYPMDRVEALHAASYDIKLSWKNTPGENELVLSCEISTSGPRQTVNQCLRGR